MEVIRYTGEAPSKHPKVPLSFGPKALLTSGLPESGGDAGDFQEIKLDSLAVGDGAQSRQFTATTVEIFIQVQDEMKKYPEDPIPQSVVHRLSIAYRGAILDLVHSYQNSGDSEDCALLYSQLECVWHFCEIMLISSHPDYPILPYLMDWIKMNFDDTNDNLMKIIPELPDLPPENLALLWTIIFNHVIHGRTDEASKLLEYTNQDQSSVFAEQLLLMTELMESRPEFRPNKGSLTEFNSAWHSWRQQVEDRLQSQTFYESQHLTLLGKILAGRDEGLREARIYLNTWHEYLCMLLNYQYPLLRPEPLKAYARKAIDDYGDGSLVLSNLDNILLAAMDFDIVTVLRDIQTQWNHPWFPLHFSDLIYSGGTYAHVVNTRVDYRAVGPIRNELVKEYGISLMQDQETWEFGTIYLTAIPPSLGLPLMAQLLQRLKPSTDLEAEKILRVTEQFGFVTEHQSLCRQMSVESLSQNRLQNALIWAIRGQDVQMTTGIVDRILEGDSFKMIPVLLEVIPRFPSCGDRLLYLRGMCEAEGLMKQGKGQDALGLMCKVVRQGIVPKRVTEKFLTTFRDLMVNYQEVRLDSGQISLMAQFIFTQLNVRNEVSTEIFNQVNKILLSSRSGRLLDGFMTKKLNRLRVPAGPAKS